MATATYDFESGSPHIGEVRVGGSPLIRAGSGGYSNASISILNEEALSNVSYYSYGGNNYAWYPFGFESHTIGWRGIGYTPGSSSTGSSGNIVTSGRVSIPAMACPISISNLSVKWSDVTEGPYATQTVSVDVSCPADILSYYTIEFFDNKGSDIVNDTYTTNAINGTVTWTRRVEVSSDGTITVTLKATGGGNYLNRDVTSAITRPSLSKYYAQPSHPPTIKASSTDLGTINSAPTLTYIIDDNNLFTDLTFTETCGDKKYEHKYKYVDYKTAIPSQLSNWFGSLPAGSHTITATVSDGEYSKSVTVKFTKNSTPTITPSTTNLGNIYSWSGLTYTIRDADNQNVTFTETCGSFSQSTTIAATAAGVNQASFVSSWFASLGYGSHTITATVSDGVASNSCSVSFTKIQSPNSAPTIYPSNMAHGGSNTFKTLNNWTVSDAEGGAISYTEVLDGATTLQSGSITLSAGASYAIASKFDQTKWNACSYAAHTVTFTATDSRGASVTGSQTFTKTNYTPEITAITPENLNTTHSDPQIQYTVLDRDSHYTITEYIDNNPTGTTYPNIPAGTTTTKTAVLNYSGLTFDTHRFKVVVTDGLTGLTAEKTWVFTKGYNAPIISGSDGMYGTYSGAPTITYEAYDPDNLAYNIIEYIDGNVFYSKNGCSGTYKGSMNLASPWPSLSNGNHTIKILATNAGNVTATRTWTVVKDNKAPTISGNNVNLGNINSILTYDYTVSDPEGDVFTVIEKVDGTILKSYTNCTGNMSFTLDLNTVTTSGKKRWDELSYDATHTIDIVASDNQGQSATRTISFTKVNVPPAAPEFVTLTNGMRRGNKENNYTFDVEIKPKADPDGDTQYLSVEAATNFSFTENVKVFDPSSYSKKAPNSETWVECVSASNTDVVAGYTYKIPVSGLTPNTEWYLRLVTTDKTGSGKVVKSTPILISIGDTLEIETFPKDCLNNRPIYIRIEMNSTIDPLADIMVYTCNNAYDATPAWENCTAEYKNSTAYTYKNSTKTAATWAIGVRVKIVANNATGPIGISNLCISAKRQVNT